jgi:hypothetical protein
MGKGTVSVNGDGLGNRMKCWVNTLALDSNAKLFWPKNSTISTVFTDLFIDEGFLVDEIPDGFEMSERWRLTAFPDELIPEGFALYKGHEIESGKAIDFEYNRIPSEVRSLFLPYFLALTPVDLVTREVDAISAQFTDSTVSVHVRTWIDAPKRASKYSINNYFKIMDEYEGKQFFIACDAESELAKFRARYGERVLSYSPKVESSIDSFQYALIEMYLLSKNSTLITSYASTFSEVAWWLGGADAAVRIVPNKDMGKGVDDVNKFSYYLHKILERLKRIFFK